MAIPIGTVLLVEDDASTREAIERLLQSAGAPCRAYASAEDFLSEEATVSGPACVVSDLSLPAMSGLDLFVEMRARGIAWPRILVTAHDSTVARERATREKVEAYLVKPFRGTELLAAIESALKRCA